MVDVTTEDQLAYLYGRCHLNEALTYLLIVQLGPEKVKKMQGLLMSMVKLSKQENRDESYLRGVQDYFESVNTGLAQLLLSVEKDQCETGDSTSKM